MANGSFTNYVHGSNSSNYFGLYCEYTFSQSVSGNYTDVIVSAWIRYYSIEVAARSGGSVTVGGSSKSFSTSAITNYPSGGGGVTKLTQQTIRVAHNSDGTKTGVKISVSWPVQITYAGTYYGTLTASKTVDLPAIPRASSISSISGSTIGSPVTINITRYSSSFTHYVYYSFGSVSNSCVSTNAGTSCSFTPPVSLCSQIPNSTSGTGTIRVDTYNGSTKIGSASKNFTLYVPSSAVPSVGTITLNPVDINNQNILVQGKNKITVSVSGCSAGTGSSIKSYTFSGPGISYTGTSTSVTSSGVILNVGTLTYTITVTDSRGRTASKSATIECNSYVMPYFSSFNAYRVGSSTSTSMNDTGTYIRCTYNVEFSSVSGTNNVTIKIYYRTGEGAFKSVDVVSSSTGKSGVYILSSMPIDSTYSVYATVVDNYGGSATSSTATVFSASRTMNINKYGTGVAFGKMAEYSNLLDVKWPIKSEGKYVMTVADELYTSSSGTNATVALSNSLADYAYIDICYSLGTSNNMYPYNSTRIYDPNGKQICLSLISADLSTPAKTHIYRTHYSLFENEIAMYNASLAAHVTINSSSITTTTGTNNIKIFKVLGYKR